MVYHFITNFDQQETNNYASSSYQVVVFSEHTWSTK